MYIPSKTTAKLIARCTYYQETGKVKYENYEKYYSK